MLPGMSPKPRNCTAPAASESVEPPAVTAASVMIDCARAVAAVSAHAAHSIANETASRGFMAI